MLMVKGEFQYCNTTMCFCHVEMYYFATLGLFVDLINNRMPFVK